ncbi:MULTISPECIES: hypothetical protein [unclassified Synechococcus]|uniref:hypothetical protein n=1 Tax=unclassified Synechococcus TaxID=2626047 RepID=UPI002001BD54|nr:hypothetical protein [Synechococcus sp. A10-1-5-1]UPM51211.1 hypothetical protein MY494_05490 [Synechococcus sp. A10-1-5-1]
MGNQHRSKISELTLRDYALYRAICSELEALEDTIQVAGEIGRDFLELAVAMRDRRLLIEWLRELNLPPSSEYTYGGITPDLEEQLLSQSSD